jgi:predicted porin
MFKKTILTAFVASTFASAVYADEAKVQPFDFFVSGDVGHSSYRPDHSPSVGGTDFNFRGSASYQDPSKFGAQLDGVYSSRDLGRADLSTADLAGHLFYRNERFLVGVFGQYRNPKLNVSHSSSGDLSRDTSVDFISRYAADLVVSEQAFWGAEGQAYFGDITVSGQLAKQEFINQRDISGQQLINDGYVANLKAKYFVQDNWKVEASYAYNEVKFNNGFGSQSSNTTEQQTFGIGTEYRFTDNPVSLYAQYNRNEISDGSWNVDSNQFFAGLKINFGSTTLKARDQSGASLDPVSQSSSEGLNLGHYLNSGFLNSNP